MSEENKNVEKEVLTEEQLWDVIQFAKNMSPYYTNVYTPDITNSRMQDINMNPLAADKAKVDSALKNPKDNEDNLISYSEFFELIDMVYKRMVGYVGNLPSFDLTFYPVNATVEDLSRKSYKKDYNAVLEFLDKFNHKKEFKKVMRQLVRQEVFFSNFRNDESAISYVLQELPRKYCKITQRWDYGYLFDFDMNWFLQTGIDINSYPDAFKRMYNDFLKGNDQTYIPSAPLWNRDGMFAMWQQTSPLDGFYMFKFNPDVTTKVPYFAPLFSDLVNRPLVRELQQNIYILQAQKVMVGLIGTFSDNKSGNAVDNIKIKPETMGKFLGLLRQGLSDAIKVGGAPFEDIKTLEFDGGDKNIYEKHTQITAASSGTNSRLLFGIEKPNNLETQYSVEIDEYLATMVYPQFEDFLNFYANRVTTKFKFAFKLEGTEFSTNRKNRLDTQIKLIDKGIVMPQKIASAVGMGIKEFEMQMAMGKADGFVEKLTPIMSIYQMSGDSKGGAPKKDDADLTESGQATRESGSNLDKGGEV